MTLGLDIRTPKIDDPTVSVRWAEQVTRGATAYLHGSRPGDAVSGALGRLPRTPGVDVPPIELFAAKIYEANSTDFRDNRYKVKLLDIEKGATLTPTDRTRVLADQVNEDDQSDIPEYLASDPDAIETVATNFAESIAGSHLLLDETIVMLWRTNIVETTTDAGETWGFFCPVPEFFRVWCVNDGGVAGDAANNCTFEYTIYLWSDRTAKNQALLTGVSPQRPRFPLTRYLTTDSVGLAYYDGSTPTLAYVIGEIGDTAPC